MAPCNNDNTASNDDDDDLTSFTVTQGQYVEKAAQFKLATDTVNKCQNLSNCWPGPTMTMSYSLPASLIDQHLLHSITCT